MLSSCILLAVVGLVAFAIRYASSIEQPVVGDYELGFVYRKDKLVDVIGPGKYNYLFGKKVELVDLTKPFYSRHDLSFLLQFPRVKALLEIIEVKDNQLALEYKEGLFSGVIQPGRYGYWNSIIQYVIYTYNLDEVEVPASLSKKILAKRELAVHVVKQVVSANFIGLLFIDGEFVRKLKPGTYYFWKTEQNVEVRGADLRTQLVEIGGQEILTKDKAGIRVNFDVQYKMVDIEKALVDTADYKRQMYTIIQLALREYIGIMTLDNILARKEEVAPFVMSETRARLSALGIELVASGMRDIILPGDVKAILNQVLIAQKKAQANNIMRQEETAATRSLLNTAKLMEQNDMLFRLKEMEYVERIAEKVGEITVGGGDRILGQLQGMFSASKN